MSHCFLVISVELLSHEFLCIYSYLKIGLMSIAHFYCIKKNDQSGKYKDSCHILRHDL